jgi:hypothetical protein
MSDDDGSDRAPLTADRPTTDRPEPGTTPSDSEPVIRRHARRAVLSAAIALFLVIGVGALLWTNREGILNTLGPSFVSTQLGVDATFTVAEFDLDAARIVDLSLGDGAMIDNIEITFESDPGPGPPIDSVVIHGMTLRVVLAPDGTPVVKGLEPLFARDGDAPTDDGNDLADLPFRALTLSDVTIDAETPIGQQRLTGDVSLSLPDAPSPFPMALSVDLNAPSTDSAVSLDAAIARDGASVTGTIDVSATHWGPFIPGIRAAAGRLTLDIRAAGGEAPGRLDKSNLVAWVLTSLTGAASVAWTEMTVEPDGAAPVAVGGGSADLAIGGGQVALELGGPATARVAALPDRILGLVPETFRQTFSGAATLVVTPEADRPTLLMRPDVGGAWRLDANLALAANQGPVQAIAIPRRLWLDDTLQPTAAEVESVRLDLVRGLGLPRDVALTAEAGPFSIDLTSDDGLPGLETPITFSGAVFGDLAPPLWATRVAFSGSGNLAMGNRAEALTLELAPGTRVSARGLTGTGDVRLSPDIDIAVVGRTPMSVSLLPELTAQGTLRVSPVTLALPDEDPPVSLAIDAQTVRVRHTSSRTSLETGPVAVTELETGFRVSGLTLGMEKIADTVTLDLAAAGMELAGAPFLPGPLAADMTLTTRPDGSLSALDGPVNLADGRIALDVAVEMPKQEGSPAVRVRSRSIRFGDGGLATADFVPAPFLADLPVIPEVTGALSVDLFLSPGVPDADVLTLTLDDLSVRAQGFGIEGVVGSLMFDPRALPAGIGEQSLAGALSAPVLGRAPFSVRFSIDADARARIHEMTIVTLGGDLSFIDGAFDPATTELDGTLRLRRLDLAALAGALNLEGVSATGRLSGLLPARVSPDILVVTKGTVAADGGGVLSITNPAVTQALASDNQAVQLLSEALRNFEYDTLAATLDIAPEGAGALGLVLQGANPEVLEGYPFDINVNLETDLSQFARVQRDVFEILRAITAPLRLLNPGQLPVSSDDNSG